MPSIVFPSTFVTKYPIYFAAFLLGSVIAAVSPAVVVPCLFRLRGKGYGVAKGIPTLVLAVAGIDDATSVAIFGVISSIMFSTSSLTYTIIQVIKILNPFYILNHLVPNIQIWYAMHNLGYDLRVKEMERGRKWKDDNEIRELGAWLFKTGHKIRINPS